MGKAPVVKDWRSSAALSVRSETNVFSAPTRWFREVFQEKGMRIVRSELHAEIRMSTQDVQSCD
jgi:hypothetical protein